MVVNITTLGYVVPVLAVIVIGLRASVWFNKPTAPTFRPLPGILLGVIGLTFGGAMFFSADADRGAYTSDPSCTAGFADVAKTAGAGACHVEPVYVQRWYHTSERYPKPHLILTTVTGANIDVRYNIDRSGDLWHYLRYPGGRNVTAQFFHHDVVLMETRYGIVATDREPTQRFDRWAFFAIAAGCIGVCSALFSAFFYRGSLTAGITY